MNSTVSNFFSRDAMLKRQARIARKPQPSSSLNIIVEEDESRASTSRSPSPMVKAKRRHANVSDIRIARDAPVHDDNDLSPHEDSFLSAPRPAPRPMSPVPSPESSPNSFRLTFTELSHKFPRPPTPTRSECASPTLSASSLSSSPQSGGMPLTPSTSDDEFSTPSRVFNPRRAAIQPLVIQKQSLSPSFVAEDSEPESDSEWYTREFSNILSLCSPLPPSFPHHARPDSMSITSDMFPASKRRVSKALPPTPLLITKKDSNKQLETAFPRRRNSKTRSIPNYPPPPVPPIPAHLRSSSVSSVGSTPASPLCNKTLPQTLRRPPPRSSVPADCVFDLYMDSEDGDGDVDTDSSSAFSFTMYEVDFGDELPEHASSSGLQSPASAYSQPSFDEQEFPVEDLKFELDYQLMLPLSLPGTPIDLEADIAMGLERLRTREEETIFEEAEFVIEEEQEEEEEQIEEPVIAQSAPQELVNDLFSPAPSSSEFSFSPSPSPASSFNQQQQYAYYPAPSASNGPYTYANEEKMLKSKWSTSTLGSIREDHERRGASSKLRLYFGGSKRVSGSSPKGSKVPPTPTSPFGLMSPRKASRPTHAQSPSVSPTPPSRQHHKRGTSTNSNSDVVVIGYGAYGVGVKRRGSLATVSDAGSETSASSSSSSGLRRKPIPVEMFLRAA